MKQKGSQTKNDVNTQKGIQTSDLSVLTSIQERTELNQMKLRTDLSYWLGKQTQRAAVWFVYKLGREKNFAVIPFPIGTNNINCDPLF